MKPYYQDEAVTIYHGDCRDILPTLPRVDLVLTDPPYKHTGLGGGGFGGHQFYHDEFVQSMCDFDLREYSKLLMEAAPMLIAFHSRDLIVHYANLAGDWNRLYDLHVWYKPNAIPFTHHTWKTDIEYLALVWAKKPGWTQANQALHSKVFIAPICQDSLHPTAKPVPLLAKYIYILDAQIIVDPFMGSGTTLRAAKDLGRKSIGIEIEERFCEVAANRCRQMVMDLTFVKGK